VLLERADIVRPMTLTGPSHPRDEGMEAGAVDGQSLTDAISTVGLADGHFADELMEPATDSILELMHRRRD
jgi:hypothetical protein